jgi:uncharacterized protein with von Willebrand factor type A (vWA) domain
MLLSLPHPSIAIKAMLENNGNTSIRIATQLVLAHVVCTYYLGAEAALLATCRQFSEVTVASFACVMRPISWHCAVVTASSSGIWLRRHVMEPTLILAWSTCRILSLFGYGARIRVYYKADDE